MSSLPQLTERVQSYCIKNTHTTPMAMMSASLTNLRQSPPLILSPSSITRLPANFASQLHFPSVAAGCKPLVLSRTHRLQFRCLSALTPELKTTLDKVVTSEKVVLFMKGTKDFPQCGFSNNVVQILKSLNAPFETINILENELLRQGLKEYSSWPTFPQLYIDGEFFGGCDIVIEAYQNGELQELLERALLS